MKAGETEYKLPHHFTLAMAPKANPQAMIIAGAIRFTILTSRMIRMEYCPDGQFEDRATQAFWFREQPVPAFTKKETESSLEIITEHLHLTYHKSSGGFTKETLQIGLLNSETVWHFGDVDSQNLGGTLRTLDGANGSKPLPPGLMSKSGWSITDDSHAVVFDDDCWIEDRKSNHASKDLYFFGYGHDYLGCLRDYCKVGGAIPMIPRWALGNWWSRYWEYSENELKELVTEFKSHDIPLSVCILDMDWHIVKNPNHNGWTGYTWNSDLFPDPKQFLDWLHDQGIRTALNLHPRDGIASHESAYPEIATAMGIDPESKKLVEFDITDKKFTDNYFKNLHHPLEKQGIDFWWMDWQQGSESKLAGLDPLWWLNHLHFLDLQRDGKKRPLIFSRWGQLGNHRYPIGFSGDTIISWKSLAFQSYFTASASNVGYCYWSHDIGGYMGGTEDPELFLRWIQFGTFSPILRIHSGKSPFQDRRPWMQGDEVSRLAKEFMQLRYALIPYIYTSNYQTFKDCVPLVRPMYYDYPEKEEAYLCKGQYAFGSELIVAPFASPIDPDTRLSRQVVWLPKGDWYNFFTGEHHPGGRFMHVYGKLEDMPVYARAGAIVPLSPKSALGNTDNPSAFDVHLLPGADGELTLYEDDGQTINYTQGDGCLTTIKQKWNDNSMEISIDAPRGNHSLIPKSRAWNFIIHGMKKPDMIERAYGDKKNQPETVYNQEKEMVTFSTGPIPINEAMTISLATKSETLLSRRDRRDETLASMLKTFHATTDAKWHARRFLEFAKDDIGELAGLAGVLTKSQSQALCETKLRAGYEIVTFEKSDFQHLVIWNPERSPYVKFAFRSDWGSYDQKGEVPEYFHIADDRIRDDEKQKLYKNESWTLRINMADAFVAFDRSK